MKKTLYHKISRGIKGISERYGLIIFITALLCSTTLPAKAAEEKGGELNVYEMVFGHIEDAYEWHITDIGETSLRIPLPIIVHDERGWHIFMSSRVENGATYDGFYISKEGTNSGKIVTRDNNGNEIRPVDISITKNVLALLINSAVLLIIMLKCASWYKKREVDKSVPRGGVGAIEALTVMIYDDVIKSGGFRIGPGEIENILLEHPAVIECSVIGIPDRLRGQAIKAFVVLSDKAEASDKLRNEIKEFCNTRLAEYKWIRHIELSEELPKTISGKIRRSELRNNAF